MPQIIINIPAAKAAKFAEGFLEQHPKPASFGANDLAWITLVLRKTATNIAQVGLRDIAHRTVLVDEDYTE